MQIPQAVSQQVNIPSSSPVDRAVKTESRLLLQKMASDLIKKDGTVKSGYLKLNVSNNESSIISNHIGGGATAATTLVKDLVMNAYGKAASDALERYLEGKGKNKVGTLSFVKLVKRMEEDFQNTTNRFEAVPKLARVKGLDSGSLDVSHLQSWPTIVNNAHSKVIFKLREVATYLDVPAQTTFTQLQDSLVKAKKHFNDLSEAIKINEADGREIDAIMPDGAHLLVRLQQVIDQLNNPKTALLKIAEGLKEDRVMTQLKLQRTEAQEQIVRLADAHEKLGQQALGHNMTAKQINEVIEQQKALLVQVQALVAQDKPLADRMFDVATRSLARAIGPVVQLDEANQPQWSQEVGPAKRSDLSAAFNIAREHMVRGNPSPVDEASHRGLSHYEYQMQSVQTRLKQQAAKLEKGSSGEDLGNQILEEMRGLEAALRGALDKRGKVEDLLWGTLYWETSKRILQDALLFGRVPSPLQEKQLQDLSPSNNEIDLCRQQALDRIKAFKAGIEANEGDVLSGTAKLVLLRALDQWDRRIRIADTSAGLDNLSHSILQQYEEPAVPESLRKLGPAWKLSKHGDSIAVYNPKTDVHLFTGTGEKNTFTLVDAANTDWDGLSSKESITYLASYTGGQRAMVLSEGLNASESYVATDGRREDLSAYPDRLQHLIASHSVFPNAPWQPRLLGYCGDEHGVKLIMEEVAPSNVDGVRLENQLFGKRSDLSPSPSPEVRRAMSTYVADAAACMADLHEQGWRMRNDISRMKNYFGVCPDGKLKLLKGIEPDAANSKPNNIKALARTLIGCMGTMGPDSEAYLRQQTEAFTSGSKGQTLLYQPDSDDAAFEFKVSSILTPVNSDGSEEDAMNVFDTDPSQRQRVYASLGLSA